MLDKVQLASIGTGFLAGFLFKLFELLAGASSKDVLKDPREWVISVIFACLSGGAAFVLARWTPGGSNSGNGQPA